MSEETIYKSGKKPRENPNLVHKHLNTQRFLSFSVNKTEPGMVAHPFIPTTREQISEFQASQSYIPCLKKKSVRQLGSDGLCL